MKLAGAALLAVLMAIGACTSSLLETTFASIDMGDGSLEVRYEQIVGSAAFASHTLRFYFRDEGGERLLAQTVFYNDGADPGVRNVAVTRLADGTWQVTLEGQEQADERWLVELGPGDVRMWMSDVTTIDDGARS